MSLRSWPPQTTLTPSELLYPGCSHPATRLVEASTEQMVHHSILTVPATTYCVNHLQIQTGPTATLPPARGREHMCWGRARGHRPGEGQMQKCSHTSFPQNNSDRGLNGEKLKEGEAGSRTYSRLVTEVSATEFRLGIEGRVSPVEDKTWPP